MKHKIDAIDRKILDLLQERSDWPVNELAAAAALTVLVIVMLLVADSVVFAAPMRVTNDAGVKRLI